MNFTIYKDSLLLKRVEIISGGGITAPLRTSIESARQGDLADQADGTNEVHVELKVKQTDAKILKAIEAALLRIEDGTYGICWDCGERISSARLEAIPWTRVCIECKKQQS